MRRELKKAHLERALDPPHHAAHADHRMPQQSRWSKPSVKTRHAGNHPVADGNGFHVRAQPHGASVINTRCQRLFIVTFPIRP
jgi:hypothetical protein